jgi:hypothetical protein
MLMFNKKILILAVIAVMLWFGSISSAQMGRGMMGPGMMGYVTYEGYTFGMGPGMMMMGPGMMMRPGMMGMMWGYNPNAKQINIDQAAKAVKSYLNAYDKDLELVEIMEFEWNFYAEVEEEDTGIHAMELLINKYTGQVYPEMGPNMMWNTKYGMMGSRYYYYDKLSAKMLVSPKQAEVLAQKYLDEYMPGIKIKDVETFYGYYTLHTYKNNKIEGMLSVNGYNGAVWYHHWHGAFIQMKEFE